MRQVKGRGIRQAIGLGLKAKGNSHSPFAFRLSPRLLFTHYALLITAFLTLASLLAISLASSAFAAEPPEKVYVVNDYRYVPANETDDRETGLSLCGTRCNALSTDYLNITEVGGWLLMKGEANRELTVELNSPFIKGQCICIVDEYLVKKDDRASDERRRSRTEK